jgi:multisubunit Na+/H+ antiporter MnhB subunit
MMWPSIITAGVGAATVLYTWARYESQKEPGMKQGDFDSLRVMNDVGWVAVGLGAAGFAASYLLFPSPSDNAKSSAQLKLNVGVQGLSIRGSY